MTQAVHEAVKSSKFPAFQANITAYTASLLAYRFDVKLNYEEIWNRQPVSEEFKALILEWSHAVDVALRTTDGMKMPTKWTKRRECWRAIQAIEVEAPLRGITEILG